MIFRRAAYKLFIALPLLVVSINADAAELDGSALGLVWVLPFVGILLSIALLPLLAPKIWHRHYGKIASAWSIVLIIPLSLVHGIDATVPALMHTLLLEYFPFMVLLITLFVVSGGIRITGNLHGSPALNTGLLALGTVMASFTGTTGAAMLLIRPLVRANDDRPYNAHVVIFFIFLVANIGGSLSPLGDPPLFLGFLHGVGFFWTTTHLLLPVLVAAGTLLTLFYFLDRYFYARDKDHRLHDPTPDRRLGMEGKRNVVMLILVLVTVLISGIWQPNIALDMPGVHWELQNAVRDLTLLAIAALSYFGTSDRIHQANHFSWGPILEVAQLFAGIFITLIPPIAMLHAGTNGAFAGVIGLVTASDGQPSPAAYFWLTGMLSGFLDNAPTYLVFFNLAGGDAQTLTGTLASVLTAISAGAVFMGALTYIGNAPNFMVKAIAEERGVSMPGFFGYMAWSCAVLLPLFALLTYLFFS